MFGRRRIEGWYICLLLAHLTGAPGVVIKDTTLLNTGVDGHSSAAAASSRDLFPVVEKTKSMSSLSPDDMSVMIRAAST